MNWGLLLNKRNIRLPYGALPLFEDGNSLFIFCTIEELLSEHSKYGDSLLMIYANLFCTEPLLSGLKSFFALILL